MTFNQQSGDIKSLLQQYPVGHSQWWNVVKQQGTPLIEKISAEEVRLTFFWQDPMGDQHSSDWARVFIDIRGLIDHHRFAPPSLKRIADTDVWFCQVITTKDWRGGYSLIPLKKEELPGEYEHVVNSAAERHRWWRALFPHYIADPLNPYAVYNQRNHRPTSMIHLPDAPKQDEWLQVDHGLGYHFDNTQLEPFQWQSKLLKNRRWVWLYRCDVNRQHEPTDPLPLVILLDGQVWAKQMPIFTALDNLTKVRKILPAVYLLIDSLDEDTRGNELPCNKYFWQAVRHELLHQVEQKCSYMLDPENITVAGQSYGGLSALYAAMLYSDLIGNVISLSGSFWWPNIEFVHRFYDSKKTENYEQGFLTQKIQSGLISNPALNIYMQSGTQEPDLTYVNDEMAKVLRDTGHHIYYQNFVGGHDILCWRGALTQGLQHILNTNSN